jgi:hypothetical protein
MIGQGLRRLHQVELTSDRLRQMARELMAQADALDAMVERPKKKRTAVKLIDPRKEEHNVRI